MRCAVYLSLGNKEMNTRNPIMATVGGCISEAYDYHGISVKRVFQ